ncbi:MAG: hypothetical protein JWO82_4156, partial [Akkermansiaceae bacterium]|nr:hypothetical protein [Akkermansiaceae bacterium]
MDEWLAVAKTFNRQKGNHMVVTSLCHHPGKGLNAGNKPISDSPSSLHGSRGTRGRFELDQLLEGAYAIKAARPQVVMRVYLAADMAEFVDLLVAAGFEVFLMQGSISMVNAASMWRFLALEEEGRCTTFTHGKFGVNMIHDVERTEHLLNLPQGLWRSPSIVGDKSQRLEARSYRPIE